MGKLKAYPDKVYEALLRFRAVIDSLECECDSYNNYVCTIHRDKLLIQDAIKALADQNNSNE